MVPNICVPNAYNLCQLYKALVAAKCVLYRRDNHNVNDERRKKKIVFPTFFAGRLQARESTVELDIVLVLIAAI